MKIDRVETFTVRYPLKEPIADATHNLAVYELAVVRIHTSAGLVGHGYSPATHRGGEVIANLVDTMLTPLLLLWPCAALTLTILAMNLLCDALRDAVDPRTVGR